MAADAPVPYVRTVEDGLPRGGMTITSAENDVVYELVVRFGPERALLTIRSQPDGEWTLAAGPGEPSL